VLKPERNRPQDIQIARVVRMGSHVMWPSVASVFVVVRLDGDGSPMYWLWAALAVVTPHLLHIFSRLADNSIEVIHRELIFAAFLQGVAVVLLDFRPLPSFAVAIPVTGFVLMGGIPLLVWGVAACVCGILLAGLATGFHVVIETGMASIIYSAVLLLVSQLALSRTTLKYEQIFRAIKESPEKSNQIVP
jgi:hypothetical protein